MVKRVETHVFCDRCGIEHKGHSEPATKVMLYDRNMKPLIHWDDLCGACSVQIERVLMDLVIERG